MKSDYQYLFPESWNLWKVTSVGSDYKMSYLPRVLCESENGADVRYSVLWYKYLIKVYPKLKILLGNT